MDSEQHVNGAVSALVMLAAIVSVYTTYSYYSDQKLANEYDENRAGMEQAASALVSLRMMQAAAPEATTTEVKADTKTEIKAEVEYAF